jgi:hypothetical protein
MIIQFQELRFADVVLITEDEENQGLMSTVKEYMNNDLKNPKKGNFILKAKKYKFLIPK